MTNTNKIIEVAETAVELDLEGIGSDSDNPILEAIGTPATSTVAPRLAATVSRAVSHPFRVFDVINGEWVKNRTRYASVAEAETEYKAEIETGDFEIREAISASVEKRNHKGNAKVSRRVSHPFRLWDVTCAEWLGNRKRFATEAEALSSPLPVGRDIEEFEVRRAP